MDHVFPLGDSTLAGHLTADEFVALQEVEGNYTYLQVQEKCVCVWGGGSAPSYLESTRVRINLRRIKAGRESSRRVLRHTNAAEITRQQDELTATS